MHPESLFLLSLFVISGDDVVSHRKPISVDSWRMNVSYTMGTLGRQKDADEHTSLFMQLGLKICVLAFIQ